MAHQLRIMKTKWVTLTLGILAVSGMVSAQPQPTLEHALKDLASEDLDTRSKAFSSMIAPFVGDEVSARKGIAGLLSKYPDRSEHIKTALIDALNGEAAYRNRLEQQGEYLSEGLLNYIADLMLAVGTFRDQRAVPGLLAWLDTGGIVGYALDDLCPGSIDTIIRAFHQPEHFFKGENLHWRAGTIAVLGGCFERSVAMRSDPEAAAKARSTLLAAIDDLDPYIRGAAVGSLEPLRSDPVVRARLEFLVRNDPFTRRKFPNEKLRSVAPKENGMRFGVREVAAYVLALPEDKSVFFVMRTPDTRECRVQGTTEPHVGEQFMGPYGAEVQAARSMCWHTDPTAKDASQCWLVYPRRACDQ